MTNLNKSKKQFVEPQLVEYGKFEELTKGGGTNGATDSAFPVGTPQSDLTFS
ncbi:MAG: lasso RiPP family leader peptide-containing protein [Cyanobacteria bacterium J06634_6]